jgi:hypothetical protein
MFDYLRCPSTLQEPQPSSLSIKSTPTMLSKPNPFEVLGLAQDCTLDQAKVQFKKIALRYHPDKLPADQKESENTPTPQLFKPRNEHPKPRANAKADHQYYKHFLVMYEDFQTQLASLSCCMKANSCSDPAHRTKLDSTRTACNRAMSDIMEDKPSSESEVSTWIAHWDNLIEKLKSEVHQATAAFPCPCYYRTDS